MIRFNRNFLLYCYISSSLGLFGMIHSFYLFRKSGECVIYRSYGESEIDENLVSGFLGAAFSFGSKVSGRNIESVFLKDKKFVFLTKDNLIFGAYADGNDTVKEELEIIRDEFIGTYGNLEDWDGDRDRFLDFLPKLDNIIGSSGKKAPHTLLDSFIQKIQTGETWAIKESLDKWIEALKEKTKKSEE